MVRSGAFEVGERYDGAVKIGIWAGGAVIFIGTAVPFGDRSLVGDK